MDVIVLLHIASFLFDLIRGFTWVVPRGPPVGIVRWVLYLEDNVFAVSICAPNHMSRKYHFDKGQINVSLFGTGLRVDQR